MVLSDGDYLVVEDKVAATLLADTGPGGLRETGDPAVACIRAGDPELTRTFGQADFPAILVRATGKTEAPSAPACSLLKIFQLRLLVLDRGLDRAELEQSVRRIAARLESVLRAQTATDQQFLGLPDELDGAEGVLVVSLGETGFPETDALPDQVTARAAVTAEIQAPCAYRYE